MREAFVRKGYDLQDADLAKRRSELGKRNDDPKATEELERVRERQRTISSERENAISSLQREADLVVSGKILDSSPMRLLCLQSIPKMQNDMTRKSRR